MPITDWLFTGESGKPLSDRNLIQRHVYPVAQRLGQPASSGVGQPQSCPLGILAWRGQVVASSATQKPRVMGIIGDRDALGGYVKVNDWNQYTIIARGGVFIHIINGRLMTVYIDDDPNSLSNQAGMVGIELEQVPTKVSVRNISIQTLDKSE